MIETSTTPGQHLAREVGRFDAGQPGPLFIAVGGMHGNEPAGVDAAQIVLDELRQHNVALRGRFVALRGNRQALELRTRFLEEDFNRVWTAEAIHALGQRTANADGPEEAELRDLLTTLQALFVEPIAGAPPERVVLIDLHSTSGPSQPFLCMADTLQNRKVAFAMWVPVILGLEEALPGTLLDWVSEAGHVGIAFEGGAHLCEQIVVCHRAALLCVMRAADMLPSAMSTTGLAVERAHAHLLQLATGLPRIVEIIERHGTEPGDGFEMLPGWQSFQNVARGERLAHDRSGALVANRTGCLLLPRYQKQGNDGFFLGRRVRPFWLGLSAVLRRLGAERGLTWLPGVRRAPDDPRSLLVDPKRARFFRTELFHLFGYRRSAWRDGDMVVVRRPDDPAELARRGWRGSPR